MQRALNLAIGAGISPLHQWKPRRLSSLPRFAAALPRHRRFSLSVSSPTSSPSSDLSSRQFLVRYPPAPCPRSGAGCRAIRMSATGSESHADAAAAPPVVAPVACKSKISFCQFCGGPTKQVVPDGDVKVRAVCTNCGNINYENPKMVVGCLVEHSNKVLLCKRNIEPSYGLWTLPAGYLEIGESAAEGAIRETLEEASADVEVLSPFAQLDIPRIGQSYIMFRAKLNTPHFSPGPESSECALFYLDEIPFDSLAFSSIFVTLKLYIEDIKSGNLNFHYCTINKRPGASPSDPNGFSVDYQLHCQA